MDYLGKPSVITRVHLRGSKSKKVMDNRSKGNIGDMTACGAMRQGMQVSLQTGKDNEVDSVLEPPEGIQCMAINLLCSETKIINCVVFSL